MTSRLRILKDILWALALFGLVAGVLRMRFGLGATTNLSDGMPWGLWKILNMVAGVALSTGGFTIGFLVYVLRIERFRALVKPAILVAFLGYGSSCLALLFDIGIPRRFWHPFLMWNEHSFLFEVFWCVILYFTVTFIEVLPPILDRLGAERVKGALHRVTFGVVVFGISLSSLHHSSLGSLFLVTPLRLHSLWYSHLLPLFFILSAMGAGMMMIVLLRVLYAREYDPEPVFGPQRNALLCAVPAATGGGAQEPRDLPALRSLARIAAAILGLYFVLKVADLVRSGAWEALLAGSWESWLYAVELMLAAPVPILLVALPRNRRSPTALGAAAFLAVVGLVMNRLDVGIFGFWHDAQTTYFPSLLEWGLSLGVVAAAALVFLAVVENCAIFDENWRHREAGPAAFRARFDELSRVWTGVLTSGLQRVSLIAVVVLPLAWVVMYPPFHDGRGQERVVHPPTGVDAVRAVLRIDGNQGGVLTEFKHADHQKRLGGENSCATCHHVSMPGDRSTPCWRCHRHLVQPVNIFDHIGHMKAVAAKERLPGPRPVNRSCAICHTDGVARTAATAKDCLECHREDMWLAGTPPDTSVALARACSYERAMHGTCVRCHQLERDKVNRPDLADCGTCHVSLRPRHMALGDIYELVDARERRP